MSILKVSSVGFVLAAALLPASAQSPVSIVQHITAGKVNTVIQPEAMNVLLAPPVKKTASETGSDSDEKDSQESSGNSATASNGKTVGYRVQIFSDNNPRTAKNEARSKQRSISAKCPHYSTYVTYTSPYWRLKVGDFRSQSEAEEAAEELKKMFPAYSKEIRVVRDRINVSN